MSARFLTLVVARVALVGWLLLVAAVAIGSFVGNPAPFVLFAFVVGASPVWLMVRRRHWLYFLMVAIAAAVLPVWVLASYGADDGGVSGLRDVASLMVVLTIFAYGLVWVGYGLGRIVWGPAA